MVFEDAKSATKAKRNREISDILPLQFSKWFNSYSKSFNLKHQRKGSLFTTPFKRKRIADIQYLRKLIHYIHYNPVEAKLCSKPENWTFSSYKAIISERKTHIKKKEVIELFDDRENFIYCHSVEPQLSGLE